MCRQLVIQSIVSKHYIPFYKRKLSVHMKWIFLLVVILVIPFVFTNDGEHVKDDTEPGHLLVNQLENEDEINKIWEMIDPTKRPFINERRAKFLCGRRPGMIEHRKKNVNRSSDDEEENYVNRTIMDRIQGGRNEIYGEVPWHVNLIYEKQIGFKFYHRFCSGALVNHLWVITTARCASNFSHHTLGPGKRYVPNIWLFIGDYVTDYRDQGEQRFRIGYYYIHPSFKLSRTVFDIAILRVERNEIGEYIKMNDYVQPICLTQSGDEHPFNTNKVLISGMGNIFQGPYARAEWVRVMTATPIPCKQQNLQNLPLYCLTNTGGATPCDGDNGGPVATQVGGVWVLYGLISFIDPDGCLPTRFPPFITLMHGFSQWIRYLIETDQEFKSEIPSRP